MRKLIDGRSAGLSAAITGYGGGAGDTPAMNAPLRDPPHPPPHPLHGQSPRRYDLTAGQTPPGGHTKSSADVKAQAKAGEAEGKMLSPNDQGCGDGYRDMTQEGRAKLVQTSAP